MEYQAQCVRKAIYFILLFESVCSFWTSSLTGENMNAVTNSGTGMHGCPKWANYFEVDNTTLDCKNPKLNSRTPFRLRGDRFCEKICETVISYEIDIKN